MRTLLKKIVLGNLTITDALPRTVPPIIFHADLAQAKNFCVIGLIDQNAQISMLHGTDVPLSQLAED